MSFVPSVPENEESVTAVMKRYPDQAFPITELTQIVMRSGECAFDDQQRELIGAFASGTNQCTYCYNTHKATPNASAVALWVL